jgi:hypothetical protein
MRLRGRVERARTATGSKSERVAVRLVTETGEFVLRRQGGHAFQDPVLDALVGRTIEGEGTLQGNTFIMSTWTVEPA